MLVNRPIDSTPKLRQEEFLGKITLFSGGVKGYLIHSALRNEESIICKHHGRFDRRITINPEGIFNLTVAHLTFLIYSHSNVQCTCVFLSPCWTPCIQLHRRKYSCSRVPGYMIHLSAKIQYSSTVSNLDMYYNTRYTHDYVCLNK